MSIEVIESVVYPMGEEWIDAYADFYSEQIAKEELDMFRYLSGRALPGLEINFESPNTIRTLEYLGHVSSFLFNYTPEEIENILYGRSRVKDPGYNKAASNLRSLASTFGLLPNRPGNISDSLVKDTRLIHPEFVYYQLDPFDTRSSLFSPFGVNHRKLCEMAPNYFFLKHLKAVIGHADYFDKINQPEINPQDYATQVPLQEMVYQIFTATVLAINVHSMSIDEIPDFIKSFATGIASTLKELDLKFDHTRDRAPLWERILIGHYGLPFELLKVPAIEFDAYADKIIETLVELGIVTID